ncbi:hypothetical protein G3N55_10070, partial [Dissulfurirhabdus thermomarina]
MARKTSSEGSRIQEAEAALAEAAAGRPAPAYLFLGERPLCRPWIDRLLDLLVPAAARDFNLEVCDGEGLAEGTLVERLETRPFFPGRKVVWVRDAPFFHSAATFPARWRQVRALAAKGATEAAIRRAARLVAEAKLSPAEAARLPADRLGEALGLEGEADLAAWCRGFLEQRGEEFPETAPGAGAADGLLLDWLARRADPGAVVLVLEAEAVDRRGRSFRRFKTHGRVLDLSPEADRGGRAEAAAAEFARRVLTEAGKRIEAEALRDLLAKVGPEDRVALRTELEKLCAAAGGRGTVTAGDVAAAVVRHREEAVYELTDAVGAGDPGRVCVTLHRLLAQGVHPLAVLRAVANFVRRMAVVRAALERTGSLRRLSGLTYARFQAEVLPGLREAWGEPLPGPVRGLHPYALYKVALRAPAFPLARLLGALAGMAEVDFALKGG